MGQLLHSTHLCCNSELIFHPGDIQSGEITMATEDTLFCWAAVTQHGGSWQCGGWRDGERESNGKRVSAQRGWRSLQVSGFHVYAIRHLSDTERRPLLEDENFQEAGESDLNKKTVNISRKTKWGWRKKTNHKDIILIWVTGVPDKGFYLLQLTGVDHRSVAILIVGQAKQDVFSDGPGHDPGILGWEGDAAAVFDFTFCWHEFSQDHHEQGTLKEREKPLGTTWDKSVHTGARLTFPAPVDPATASIFPFSRYRLTFFRTGVTYRLVKKRPGSFMCPFALFSRLIFSNNSLIPCSRIYRTGVHCFVWTETSW